MQTMKDCLDGSALDTEASKNGLMERSTHGAQNVQVGYIDREHFGK